MTARRWVRACSLDELEPGRGVAALVDGQQVALFLLPGTGGEAASRLRAIDNHDPVAGANVLSRGLLGSAGDVNYVASPMLKHRFDLATGQCLDGESPGVRVWPVRVWGRSVEVLAVSGERPPAEAGQVIATHCPYCALQCSMGLRKASSQPGHPSEPGALEAVVEPSFPVNQGRMCIKGWSSVELLRHPDRLSAPMVRDSLGELRTASWDTALDELAGRLMALQEAHGRSSVGAFGSGALTNEKAYLLGKFARVALRTPHIDYNGRFCMASAAAAQNRSFGIDRGLPFPLSDIELAGTLVLWGSNPADTMPPLLQWLDRQRARGGKLVVVDPRRSATAELADLHVQPVPGTDLAVALGLLHLAIRSGHVDEEYVRERTAGWRDVEASVAEWSPTQVERSSGVPAAQVRELSKMMAGSPPSLVITGRGPEQQVKGVDTVTALINLMLALGQVGKVGGGYGCLTGQANGQGGREHGQKADQLPGYRSISDRRDRSAVARIWGIDPAELPGPGMSAVEMLQSIGRQGEGGCPGGGPGGGDWPGRGDGDGDWLGGPQRLRGLLVVGSNIAVASPDSRATLEALSRLELLAVLDAFPNETTEHAHIVLPVTQWAEEDGTTTNLEGRVIRRRRACAPPSGARSDIDVLCDLASRLGQAKGFDFPGPEAVFEELRAASAGGRADYSGITYDRMDREQGVYWPCPAPGHPGTPRLFTERFAHPDGRARFVAVDYRPAFERRDSAYPLYFTTGRYREQYNSGSQTRRVSRLREAQPEPRLQIHPELAARLGVSDGDALVVESRRGPARFKALVDSGIRTDTVFAPFHWGGAGSANLLTVSALDPLSHMPELKVCAVRIRPDTQGSPCGNKPATKDRHAGPMSASATAGEPEGGRGAFDAGP